MESERGLYCHHQFNIAAIGYQAGGYDLPSPEAGEEGFYGVDLWRVVR